MHERASKNLPDDINALKALVVAKEALVAANDQRIAELEELLQLALHKRFGASAEKANAGPVAAVKRSRGVKRWLCR